MTLEFEANKERVLGRAEQVLDSLLQSKVLDFSNPSQHSVNQFVEARLKVFLSSALETTLSTSLQSN